MNTRGKQQVENDGRGHAVVLGGSLAGLLAARVLAAPWMLATGEDYRYRETVGGSPNLMNRFMHRYMDQVVQLATRSIAVRHVLLRAFNMLVPPTALFHPKVLLRVLLNVIKPSRTPKPHVAPKQMLYHLEARD